MPSVPTPPDQVFPGMLADLVMRVRAIETQQQATYSNRLGQAVINTGLSPGSDPAQYGIQLVDPSTGAELAFFGEDGSGNVGLTFRDNSGNIVCRLDSTGLHIYNASGTVEMTAGVLNASPAIYGLGVLPYGGSELQQVGGHLTIPTVTASNVTATSWTNFTGTSSVTAEIGPAGSAVVGVQGYIATGTAGQQGIIGVAVDGTSEGAWAELASGAGGVSGTVGSTYTVTGLAAGLHTFQLQYKTVNNGSSTCTFTASATIQPL